MTCLSLQMQHHRSFTSAVSHCKTCLFRYNPFVRLDLYLKACRLVKRRTIAQEMCDAGRVLVNGSTAKPAKEIKTGDALRLSYPSRIVDIEVLAVPASSKNIKTPPEELYRVTGEQRLPRDASI